MGSPQWAVMRNFDVSFDVSLNKLLNKQSRDRWIKMSWHPADVVTVMHLTYWLTDKKSGHEKTLLDIHAIQYNLYPQT